MTQDQLARIGAAAVKHIEALDALAESERLGQTVKARSDRASVATAEKCLRALITETR